MKQSFPWYSRMHALLKRSPVIVKTALAHSTTPLNVKALTVRKDGKPRARSPVWDIENDNTDSKTHQGAQSSPLKDSHAGSPGLDGSDDEDGDTSGGESEPDATPVKTQKRSSSEHPPASGDSKKRKQKTFLESLEEISEKDRMARTKVKIEKERQRTERLRSKYSVQVRD